MSNGLHRLADLLGSQQLLNKLGLAGTRRIKKRTRKGIGADGQRFDDYSKGHARKRKRERLPTDVVNLHFLQYGGMLAQMDHEVNRTLSQVELLFRGERANRLAGYHNEQGAGTSQVKRVFMRLNDEDEAAMGGLVEQEIADLIKLQRLGP